ncbi:sirohydrochlorin cobaltochelatase [Neosynechococcus sphagnicola sy1]|uniref:Sirohydrochlorin cobaltochelatase n=1 Tax=Neosynechococcus sphagnicola sy1 TaxID=1497020 RepID=A0A098TL17_9CYAN|nr:sirohydrochlorin chelatase [Neosynechococcus sphagnicola]KGF71538.1 sirohydrochlorin cobaltochelatase [Neosynechococcus sphagnicola sy1]
MLIADFNRPQPSQPGMSFAPLPLQRPLLMVGHGSRDADGRQEFLDFASHYQALDSTRPVVPCFLELTQPSIQAGIECCVAAGYEEFSVLPILLFAARHNKFDVTNELDRAKQRHPQLKFYYGRHFGITPGLLDLWHQRLAVLDQPEQNPQGISRADTVLLVVGRGSSDADANSDIYKLARMLWEGSGYLTVETCFIGITHPRLEEGFRRARLYHPQRVIVLPYFLFTGVLVKKIFDITAQQQQQYPEISLTCLPEMGKHPQLFQILRDREIETQLGQVQMNCEMCKFRLAVAQQAVAGHGHSHSSSSDHDHGHSHHHDQDHSYEHHHNHGSGVVDREADLTYYHQRVWQVP